MSTVQALYHTRKSVLGYNDKLVVIKKALEQFQTAIFLDADVRILGPVTLRPEAFTPGIKAFLLRDWAFVYKNHDRSPSAPQWMKDDFRIMKILQAKYQMPNQGLDVPYVVEFLFSITKDEAGKTDAFLRKWNDLASFCERNRFFRHLGYSIGLAALLTRFPQERFPFEGLDFFEPLISRNMHLSEGKISEGDYQKLSATIHRLKFSPQPLGRLRARLAPVETSLRYWRVRLFGLDLLGA